MIARRTKGSYGPPLRDGDVREGLPVYVQVKGTYRPATVTGEAAPANGVRRWLLRAEAPRRGGGAYLEPRPASLLRARAVEVVVPLFLPDGGPNAEGLSKIRELEWLCVPANSGAVPAGCTLALPPAIVEVQ